MSEEFSFYATQPFPCGYFKERTATYAVLKITEPPDLETQSVLLNNGFRRSHNSLYVPHCDGCTDCIPCRIEVEKFRPSKSQRRCIQRNRHWKQEIVAPEASDEIVDLFCRYQQWKHPETADDQDNSLQFLSADWSDTVFILTRDQSSELLSVTVVDRVPNGLSAVYNFYHEDQHRYGRYSLGAFAILNEIAYTQSLGLPYLYMGYYLKDTPKMSYKIKYQPLELLIDHVWLCPAD